MAETLGPVTMDVDFVGAEFYLGSSATVDWQVYSPVNIDIAPTDAVAIDMESHEVLILRQLGFPNPYQFP